MLNSITIVYIYVCIYIGKYILDVRNNSSHFDGFEKRMGQWRNTSNRFQILRRRCSTLIHKNIVHKV